MTYLTSTSTSTQARARAGRTGPFLALAFVASILASGLAAAAPPSTAIRFMVAGPDDPGRKAPGATRRWTEVTDAGRLTRLRAMADNAPARLALELFAEAWRIAPPDGVSPPTPTLFVALEDGGNYARHGLVLTTAAGTVLSLPAMPYLILGEQPHRFRTTLLHESTHAAHALLVGPAGQDDEDLDPVAPIPHSTAAVTNRRTAFNEGLAIHMEAVHAHCGTDEPTRRYYQRRELRHGPVRGLGAEYYGPVRDLLSYSQNFARYQHVRDGLYAFEPAPATDDYLRLQLDPARDLRSVRSGSALVASEGFVATVLFQLMVGEGCGTPAALAERYRPLFDAIRAAEQTPATANAVPIVEVVAALRRHHPPLGARAVHVFLDVSKGSTIDATAPRLWARLFDAALHIDRPALAKVAGEIEERRRAWEKAALADPRALLRAIGPVVVLEAPAVKVGLALFGPPAPLSFDINAAGPAVLRIVPGVTGDRADAIVAERASRPFADAADFVARTARLGIPHAALGPRVSGH